MRFSIILDSIGKEIGCCSAVPMRGYPVWGLCAQVETCDRLLPNLHSGRAGFLSLSRQKSGPAEDGGPKIQGLFYLSQSPRACRNQMFSSRATAAGRRLPARFGRPTGK
jgi:hypothetical protein